MKRSCVRKAFEHNLGDVRELRFRIHDPINRDYSQSFCDPCGQWSKEDEYDEMTVAELTLERRSGAIARDLTWYTP